MLKERAKSHWPEIVFGALLLALVFLMGFVIGSSPHPSEPTEQNSSAKAYDTTDYYYPYYIIRDWFSKDAAGFFTFLLFVIGSGQIALFYVQLRLIRESLDDAKEVAKATTDAAKAATRQANIAENTFKSVERPHVLIFGPGKLSILASSPVGDPKVVVGYHVGNYGRMPAIIKFASVGFGFDRRPLLPTMVDRTHILMSSPVLPINEPLELVLAEISGKQFMMDDKNGEFFPKPGQEDLFLWVIVQYRGPFTDQHETSACWRFDHITRRFIGPHGGEQYNWHK